MANPTVQQQITALEAELVIVKAQMATLSSGMSSYTLGDLSVSKSNSQYSELRKTRTSIEKSLQRLYRGGRGFVIDASYNDSGSGQDASTGNTEYVHQSS